MCQLKSCPPNYLFLDHCPFHGVPGSLPGGGALMDAGGGADLSLEKERLCGAGACFKPRVFLSPHLPSRLPAHWFHRLDIHIPGNCWVHLFSFLKKNLLMNLYNIASVLCLGFSACGILVSWLGIKPALPASEGKVLTTGLPGRPWVNF